MESTPSAQQAAIPALLRAARGGYGHAVRERLADGGFEDLPRNGPYVLGGIVKGAGDAGSLVRQLGISKQAASQLIDILVVRGYLERAVNVEDRRRVTLEVTDRGRAAAAAVSDGVQAVDAELAGLISPAELAGLRSGLIALCDIRERMEAEACARAGTPPGA
ncbi:MAG: MarR family transcriptional regulator [Solirubrobacteraceae bacterium]|jgi:DNA-binding MarR family transcriptional regulator